MIEWGIAGRTHDGQALSGDRAVVAPFPGGVLVGVIDGLGHGEEAAHAAVAAVRVLEGAPELPVDELIRRCHHALRSTRGAVMSLVSIRSGELWWIGVGNVDAVLLKQGSHAALPALAGIVGYSLPRLNPRSHALAAGDLLVLASDGVRSGRYEDELVRAPTPQDAADQILAHHARGSDDACVVVARYLGLQADRPALHEGRRP